MFFKTVKGKSVPTKAPFVVVGVFVAALCVYVGLRVVDSVRFSKLKTDVVALGDRMVAVAPTDKSKAVQYCKYSSQKYRKGPRTCSSKYYFQYDNLDKKQSDAIYNKLVALLEKSYTTNTINSVPPNEGELPSREFQLSSTSCFIQGWYHETKVLEYGLIEYPWDGQVQGLVVSVGCSGAAMTEHYPLHGLR